MASSPASLGPREAATSAGNRRAWVRAGVLTVLVAAAYPISLLTLVKGLTLDTPLAYLALVPVIALLLAGMRSLTPDAGPDIRDRYVDYIVGVPLLLLALSIVVIAPVSLSTEFWAQRLDILSLPLFVAGAMSLMLGVRTTWRMRVPIAYLLLAWPVLYQIFLDWLLVSFTDLTIAAVRGIVAIIPVALATTGGDGSVFIISHAGKQFALGIGSACSGVNGMLGFLLVGIAFMTIVRGRLLNKLVWLGVGMGLIWSFDVLRIMAIFGAGSAFGEEFAIDVLHPFVGLLAFSIGVLAMLALLPTFRLRLLTAESRPRPVEKASSPAAPRRRVVGVAVAVLATMIAGLANVQMGQYQAVAGDLGNTMVAAGTVIRTPINGWMLQRTATYPWISRYMGEDAIWERYVYGPSPLQGVSPYRSSTPIFLDLFTTSDASALSAYGVQQCYQFHGLPIVSDRPVALGGGVTGRELAYRDEESGTTWSAVYWEWPVHSPDGSKRYERIVLHLISAGSQLSAPPRQAGLLERAQMWVAQVFDSSASHETPEKVAPSLQFLSGFAGEVVGSAIRVAHTGSERANSSAPGSGAPR